MDKVEISVCIRPYRHDVLETIERKPKYDKGKDMHFVTYKGRQYPMAGKISGNYHIWVDEE